MCPGARHIILCLVLGPSQHDRKIVDWDIKNQNNLRTESYELCPSLPGHIFIVRIFIIVL